MMATRATSATSATSGLAGIALIGIALATTALLGCDSTDHAAHNAADQSEAASPATTAALGDQWRLPAAGIVQGAPWAKHRCTPGKPGAAPGKGGATTQLACVDGVAITRADFDRVRPLYPPHVSNRAVIEALVRAEVLAHKAAKAGLWSSWLVAPYRQALVRRYLIREFEERYQAKDVQAKDIDRTWRRGPIRIRYAHEKAWWVTDAQLICCHGDWKMCKIDPKAQACITRLQPMAYELYGKLMMDPPTSPNHMCARVLAMKSDFPLVTCDHLNYFYDDKKPYDQQGDFDLMQEPYVKGIAKLKEGQVGEPIRTPYGWHIVRLDKIDPKKAGKISDPDVRDEIAHGILNGVRIRDVQLRALKLLRENNVAIFYDNLDKGLIGGATAASASSHKAP